MARVLLVAAAEKVREGLRAALSNAGHSVLSAASAEPALTALVEHDVDVALVGIALSGSSGSDLIQAIRSRTEAVQVVVIVCHPTADSTVEAVQVGALEPLSTLICGTPLHEAVARAARTRDLELRRRRCAHEAPAHHCRPEQLGEKHHSSLQTSEQWCSRLLEAAHEGIWVIDAAGRTTYANPSMADLIGHTVDDMIGRHFFDFIDEQSVERASYLLERRRAGVSEQHEFEFLHRDGRTVHASLATSPLFDERGVYQGAIAGVTDIGEQKRAEEQLVAAARQWQTTFDAVSDAVLLVDNEARITRCNRAATVLLGRPSEEIIGGSCFSIVHGTPQPIHGCPFVRMRESGKREEYDFQIGNRWVNASVDPVLDDQGTLVGAVHIMIDITERRRAEAKQRESEQRFRLVTETVADVFWVSTPGVTEMIYVSPAYEQIWGRSLQEVLERPRSFVDAIHPEDRQRYLAVLESHHARAHPYNCEYRIACPDGSERWINERGYPVAASASEQPLMTGVCTDITARTLAVQRLEEEHSKLNVYFESLPALAYNITLDGTIADVNAMAVNVLGYVSKEQLIGKPLIPTVYAPPSRARAKQLLEQWKRGGKVANEELQIITRDGETIDVLLNVDTIIAQDGRPLNNLTTQTVITELKQTQEALRASRRRLRSLSSKLVTAAENERSRLSRELHDQVGQALATLGIALNTVSNRLSATADRETLDRLDSCSLLVEDTAQRIRHVTSDLRPPVLDDYGVVVALRWFARTFSERTALPIEVIGDLGGPRLAERVEISLFRICQEALTNVVRHAQASRAEVVIEESEAGLRVSVTDDGIGFDVSEVSVPSETGGWGLHMMRERALALDGELQVESEPRAGTRVVIELPR